MIQSSYNFPTPPNFGTEFIDQMANTIFQLEISSFKINFSFGVILRQIYTNEYSYFIPHSNLELFDKPMLISNNKDLTKLKKRLAASNFIDLILSQRPSSRYKAVFITNIRANVTRVGFSLGCVDSDLPQWLTKQSTMIHNTQNDNCCMFRALSNCISGLPSAKKVRRMFWQWKKFCQSKQIKVSDTITDFKGVDFTHIHHFENCFKVNVNIYQLDENGCCKSIRKSLYRHDKTLNLNRYSNHVSYIKDMKSYCRKFKCVNCSKLFRTSYLCKIHSQKCAKQSRYVFPGSFMAQKLNVFEKLSYYGIHVAEDLRYHDFYATYDMESWLQKVSDKNTANCKFTQKHIPISFACTSNVPGFTEPVCHISKDPDELIRVMVEYFYKIQAKSKELSMEKWGRYLKQVEDLLESYKPKEKSKSNGNNEHDDGDSEGNMEADVPDEPMCPAMLRRLEKPNVYRQFQQNLIENNVLNVQYNSYSDSDDSDNVLINEDEELLDDQTTNDDVQFENLDGYLKWNERLRAVHYNKLKRIHKEFSKYISELVILGYNNARYDHLICADYLLKHLEITTCTSPFVIKQSSAYLVISNGDLKFLDAMRYLANSCSYSSFLKAYEVEEQKGLFPFDWFDDPEKLDATELPPIECWHSNLKNKSLLGDSESEISENYEWVQEVWRENNMKFFSDFLSWYNKRDVSPFLLGLHRLADYFRVEHSVDLFRLSISAPGTARYLIYQSAYENGASFFQFGEKHAHIYRMFRRNITGGPSLVYSRLMECNKTRLRGPDGPLCKSIVGLDSNALYPHSYFSSFPINAPILRYAENDFEPESCGERYTAMYDYLDYLAMKLGVNIRHKLNSKTEVLIGLHPLDGFYVKECGSRVGVEYDGCWVHGCLDCDLVSAKSKVKYHDLLAERRARTQMRNQYLKSQNIELIIMKECEWKTKVRNSVEIQQFIRSRRPLFYQTHPGKCTEKQIIDAVLDGTLFGFVECDIHCPDEWSDTGFQSQYSAKVYYSEFNPIYMRTYVPSSAWGDLMRQHAIDNNIPLTPRKLLVGGTKGKKLLLLTDLLQW